MKERKPTNPGLLRFARNDEEDRGERLRFASPWSRSARPFGGAARSHCAAGAEIADAAGVGVALFILQFVEDAFHARFKRESS